MSAESYSADWKCGVADSRNINAQDNVANIILVMGPLPATPSEAMNTPAYVVIPANEKVQDFLAGLSRGNSFCLKGMRDPDTSRITAYDVK